MRLDRIVIVVLIYAALSAISLALLLWRGFDLTIHEPSLRVLLEQYDELLFHALGWIEPSLRSISSFFTFELPQLNSDWRHVFVLMWLYFVNDSRTFSQTGRHFAKKVGYVWGSFSALTASLSFGFLAAHVPPVAAADMTAFFTYLIGNFVPAVCVVAGYFIYAVGVTWANAWRHRENHALALGRLETFDEFFWKRVGWAGSRASAGALIILVSLAILPLLPSTRSITDPAFVVMFPLICALGALWLYRGVDQGLKKAEREGGDRLREVLTMGNTQLGLTMITAILTASTSMSWLSDLADKLRSL